MSRQVRGRARVECRSADFWAYWLNLGGAWCEWDWSTQPPPTGSISAFAADQKIERAIGYRARTNVGGERMDRKMELNHLKIAEKAVADGERYIEREEQLLADLDRAGHDTKQARETLANFRRMQAEHSSKCYKRSLG
jgi:hypothetical protein